MNATAFNTYSDATLKDEVTDVDLSPVFRAVNVKSYVRSDKPSLGRRVGFLAQDIQKACSDNDLPSSFNQEMQQEDGTTLLGLDYTRLCCVLWSEVQQLESRLQAIEQAIENA